MKELRRPSTGRSELRILFAFDRKRRAILLLGVDKRGVWREWYRENIPIADDRFDAHQQSVAEEQRNKTGRSRKGKKK